MMFVVFSLSLVIPMFAPAPFHLRNQFQERERQMAQGREYVVVKRRPAVARQHFTPAPTSFFEQYKLYILSGGIFVVALVPLTIYALPYIRSFVTRLRGGRGELTGPRLNRRQRRDAQQGLIQEE